MVDMSQKIKFKVNGVTEEVNVEPGWSLAYVLREVLNLMGTKVGCETGNCGTCTVLVDGKAIKSCLFLAVKAKGKEIVTIEGLKGKQGGLHPLQEAFMDHFAVQCGYCTPGMILAAKALLDENPNPTEEDVRRGLSGNLCRCTGYVKIVEAVLAAKEMTGR
jgi:aerobic-type carbon monoxide dehydrogenase small subunit (CoxS/CutS family)